MTIKNKEWIKTQGEIQDNIENDMEKIHSIFPSQDMNVVVIFYFLMFWSRIMHRYGKHGEIEDNKFIIGQINRMMGGDVPPDIDGTFDTKKQLH